MILMELVEEMVRAQRDSEIQNGLKRSIANTLTSIRRVLSSYPELTEIAEYVRAVREKVSENIEYYIDKAIKSINSSRAHAYFAKDRESALDIIDKIIGDKRKVIIKAKSMVTEEIMLREFLTERGHEVYETDLGEFLIQISKEKPMHAIVPALHMTKERVTDLLRCHLGLHLRRDATHEEIISLVRDFLRDKFIRADVGISGANAIAADTGSIFLVHNEGNISNVVTLPPVHIVVAGVDKIMPTFRDAMLQVIAQSGYAGLYPPTYINVISGVSSTADIEYHRVYGVHGAREVHVVLYDGGRIRASKDPALREQLLCIKCGRCHFSCPIWNICGNMWGGRVYGGPMGVGWTAITEGLEKAEAISWFCVLCNACREACPVKINSAELSRRVRSNAIEKGFVPSKVKTILKNIQVYGNPFGLPSAKRAEWAGKEVPRYRRGIDILYYVGDMGSYDPRAQMVAKSLSKILSIAGLSYGILGEREHCSGCEAYEIGETGLFEEAAKYNISIFEELGVKKIVTLSPHSYNVMKNFYKDFGGEFEVKHYTQILLSLIRDGKIRFNGEAQLNKTVTFHDPCFLGRWNGEYEVARDILKSIPGVNFVEMERCKQDSLCCGGGCGNCYTGFGWGLLAESERNPNRVRVREAHEIGAEILAVACPSCLVMLEDAVEKEGLEKNLAVKDISEIVSVSLRVDAFMSYG